jgi:hypothetical protein
MQDRMDWYDKYSEKREEAFLLRLLLIEVKHDLELHKHGYRDLDSIVAKIQNILNK